ncbi:MAG: DUF2760 domain-containing protein [Deltaproteobacteria bacterium]|nr:DUF2760 domain-containing protein [Deltaproteobacteria bacterium]
MKTSDNSSRQLALWILVWFLVLGMVLAGVGYWELGLFKESLDTHQQKVLDPQLLAEIELSWRHITLRVASVLAAGLAVIGFLVWLNLRSAIRKGRTGDTRVAPSPPVRAGKEMAIPPEQSSEEKKAQARIDQRRSLHLLSLLQREGRLVDFLQENLQAYDDAQIGAAVRGIQESCRESLNKYVAPKPVIDRDEGESIMVDAGFDANSIRLTGNVSGRPPFRGTLQHRGWRTTGLNLPTLSGSQDPTIIAPAEVEIE